MEQTKSSRARFGRFELDLRAGELHGGGQPILLPVQVFRVLRILIEHEGDVATREEIKKKLWPNDTVVEFDHSINTAIKNLRKALGDSAEEPKYIETIPRRGYRLMVPVEWVGSAEDSSVGESSASGEASGSDAEVLPKARLKVGRLTGKVVSHYRVLEVIGGGGMGLVYRAEDLKLGRAVALKFLPEEVGDDPKVRERFEREAHAVSSLNHANICTVYDFDEHQGHPFIAMELLQGKTLRDHLADGHFRLTQPEGLEIAIQIALGLEAAHEKGIIHRDIKPANIFITQKNVAKILDFGVAKVIQLSESTENPHPGNGGRDRAPEVGAPDFSLGNGDEKRRGLRRAHSELPIHERGNQSPSGLPAQAQISSPNDASKGAPQDNEEVADCRPEGVLHPTTTTLTLTGIKLGTAGYMSPEQVRGEPLDARTDIFSFGLVLYEMATGERAFTGETEAILHEAIESREPKPVRELAPEISAGLETIIIRCLEKKRQSRYQSSSEICGELQQLKSKDRTRTRGQRLPARRYLAGVALAAACATGLFFLRPHKGATLAANETIVLGDFHNTTGDAVFDDSLYTALTGELEQSPYFTVLSVVKRHENLKSLGHSEFNPLTPELARQVCLRTGSSLAVNPAIADAGNRYQIKLQAIDCKSGKEVAHAEGEAENRSHIIEVIGRAGHELRQQLGEPRASLHDNNQPIEEALTSSPEALQAMLLAKRVSETKGDRDALPHLQRAVELDPKFVWAWAYLGDIYEELGEHTSAVAALQKAYDLRARSLPRNRLYSEAMYYAGVTGDLEKAAEVFARDTEMHPNAAGAHCNFGVNRIQVGQYAEAVSGLQECLRIYPDGLFPYWNLMNAFLGLNQLDEVQAISQAAHSRKLDGPELHEGLYRLAFLQGDGRAMRQQLEWSEGKGAGEVSLLADAAETAAHEGRMRQMRELSGQALNAAIGAGMTETAAGLLAREALHEAEVGEASSARRTAARAMELKPSKMVRVLVALSLAQLGDAERASQMADDLSQYFPVDTLVQRFWLPTIEARIQLQRGSPAKALEVLNSAGAYELAWGLAMYPAYVRGDAYLRNKEFGNSVAEYQKMLQHSGVVQNAVTGALARLQLGRAQTMMGDKDAARKSYQDFLTIWNHADPDIPVYKQARSEYAKLK